MLGPLLAMPSGQGLNMTLLAILKVNGANWLLVLEKNWSCGKMFLLLTRYHYWLDNIIYYQPRPLCTWQPPKKNKKNVVQILTITIALGIDLSKRLFLVQHGFSSSWTPLPCPQTWTERGNKLLPSRSDSERLMNAEQVWTGIRYMGFSMYRYGFDRNKILSWDGPEQVRTTIPRPRNSERHFPNTWGIVGFDIQIHTIPRFLC